MGGAFGTSSVDVMLYDTKYPHNVRALSANISTWL